METWSEKKAFWVVIDHDLALKKQSVEICWPKNKYLCIQLCIFSDAILKAKIKWWKKSH